MGCKSHCAATGAHFDERIARRDVDAYRRKGPNPTTKLILEGLSRVGLIEGSLLDVGAGVGVLHHELLASGVTDAVHVEASAAYIAAAQAESERRGQRDRVVFVRGDFVEVGDDLADADVVTLDRVVCCYPDYEALLQQAAQRARRAIVLSVPRDRLLVRFLNKIENASRRLSRNSFRSFIHPVAEIDAFLMKKGFNRVEEQATLGWRVTVYQQEVP